MPSAEDAMEAIVRLENVVRDYQQGTTTLRALDGIGLEIHRGEFVAVAGPSGSGKTTLLNVISGLDRPTSGTIIVDGQNLGTMSRSGLSRLRLERIGFVFQAYNLLPVLTAYENAEYVLLMQGLGQRQRRERVMRLLERVGLSGLEKRFPRELSGGQQQRVAVARAMAAEPALVLADEPTANLDSRSAAELMDLMRELNAEKNMTFVFSSHDQNVMRRAARLISLKDGAIARDGSPESLRADA
ncbi:MAG: ABC transporter ATP-binding protein [Polyangiaceae bacterium]|nr:ABC transporter ATP-binding protein [Polyangiaceae bacterium]